MVKTQTISQFCLNAADGKLIFVLNIIITIIQDLPAHCLQDIELKIKIMVCSWKQRACGKKNVGDAYK